MKKRVLILNTGGTISSVKTAHGYEPRMGYAASMMAKISELAHHDMPSYTIYEYSPLLDSSNLSLKDWNQIGADIAANYEDYDGFVVFHGTDTMAYTASALSFMLEHLGKPVILTGSQIPLSEVRSDAIDNIVTSLWLVAHFPIQEVCIYFSRCLLRGNRARKISAQRFHAFDSPNFEHLASIGIDIELNQDLLIKKSNKHFCLQALESHFIANFHLFPGFSTSVLGYLLEQPIQGLVLQTYGAGNAQNNDKRFLDLLREACNRGIVIVNCTQCQHGYVEMSQYATGHTLKEAGLISGYDMTVEAAHCKLLYLFSKYADIVQIKSLMQTNLIGELSR